MAACSLPYNMDNNIHEKITQFWLGEKGVHFSGNMNQGLVHFCWSLKNVLVLFIPNCTRNHVITYTNTRRRQIVVLKCNHLLFAPNNGFTGNRKRNNTINWPVVNGQRSLCFFCCLLFVFVLMSGSSRWTKNKQQQIKWVQFEAGGRETVYMLSPLFSYNPYYTARCKQPLHSPWFYYMVQPVFRQICALWLVLPRSGFCSTDRFHGNSPSRVFFFGAKPANSKIWTKPAKKSEYCHFSQRSYQKMLKRLKF